MPTVSVSFVGNETFLFSGKNLENVGKIDVTVTYDPSSLANPRVVPQSAFSGAIVSSAGGSGSSTRLSVSSSTPMTGSGLFATIAFDPVGTSFGVIKSVNGRVYDFNEKAISALFEYTNPSPPLDPNDPDNQLMIEERERNGESFMGGGVPYVPPEAVAVENGSGKPKENENDAVTPPATGDGSAEQRADNSREETDQTKSPKSYTASEPCVLERFRLFTGERNPKNLMALFDVDSSATCHQQPTILLADGKENLKVTISGISRSKIPSFGFRSARYISLKKLSETEWMVVARPEKDVLKAGIMLRDDGRLREIPLTVAPRVRVDLITPGKVSEADFSFFLKKRGTARAPMYDLNGDGKRDFLDDYIFTANYLIALERKKGKDVKSSSLLSLEQRNSRKGKNALPSDATASKDSASVPR